MRRDRGLRSEGGFAVRLEVRDRDQGFEQFLRRRSRGSDDDDPEQADRAGDRQGAAARAGARGLASHSRSRSDRKGRGDAMSDPASLTLEQIQEIVTRAPFHKWLGLQVIAVQDDAIEIKAKWREEWVVNVDRRFTHGGILAALIDLGADWAMVRKLGRGVPTIDMRVDYHAVAMPGDLTIKGKAIRMGSQFSCAEA